MLVTTKSLVLRNTEHDSRSVFLTTAAVIDNVTKMFNKIEIIAKTANETSNTNLSIEIPIEINAYRKTFRSRKSERNRLSVVCVIPSSSLHKRTWVT